jgi:hypothetical protein
MGPNPDPAILWLSLIVAALGVALFFHARRKP